MHIAIDDTYGPKITTNSKYVSGNRRTNIGIAFPDGDVTYIREQITSCLNFTKKDFSIESNEFHFVDIYNRKKPWDELPDRANLAIFGFFADIYRQYKWKVFIQTIDDRTIKDHGVNKIKGKLKQFNLDRTSDLSLCLLLLKIKQFYITTSEDLTVFIDEGLGKPNTEVGREMFYNYPNKYIGKFQSSHQEPLLQLADFMAFTINRSTHLYMKSNRTDIDNWFLRIFNSMEVNSSDLLKINSSCNYSDLTISHFDQAHEEDRVAKGLQSL